MAVYYLDSSALIKRYRDEKGTEVLDALFGDRRDSEVITTSLFTVLEITSVATRLLRAKSISQNAYNQLIGEMYKDFNQTIVSQSTSDSILSEAIDLITRYGLKSPDAVQLASALSTRSAFPGLKICFVCADARLKNAGVGNRLSVIDPEADDSFAALNKFRNEEEPMQEGK